MYMNRPDSSLDWVLSHWAHFTVLRIIFWATFCKTVRSMLSDRCMSVCL